MKALQPPLVELSPEKGWVVCLPVFYGPFDLLLYLVRKEKLDICAFSLAQITDHYLAYLEYARLFRIDLAMEFLTIAAQLLYLKSKLLLPPVDEGEQEEERVEQEVTDIVEKLQLYEAFQKSARWLSGRFRINALIQRDVAWEPPSEPTVRLDPYALGLTFARVFKSFQERQPKIYHAAPLRVEDHFEPLKRWARQGKTFQNYVQTLQRNTDCIAAFLALLFLIQTGEIDAYQEELFGPILLSLPSENDFAGREVDVENLLIS